MKYLLKNKDQARALMVKAWPQVLESLSIGIEMTVEFKEANKSREQEEKYHAMISEIATQAQHMGSKWDAESWKRLLVDQFCKDTGLKTGVVMPNLSGDGIVQLGFQTRKFTKEQASEFVEWLYAWSAENGVLHETDE